MRKLIARIANKAKKQPPKSSLTELDRQKDDDQGLHLIYEGSAPTIE
jgi:hypothetical protein